MSKRVCKQQGKKRCKEKEYFKMEVFDLYSEQTDWDGIRHGIDNINWELTFANINVSDMIDILEEKVTELLFKHAERKQKRKYRTRYAKNRRALFRKRNRISKKLNNCINPRLKIKFTEELRRVEENIKNWIENYTEFEERKAVSKIFNNSRYFYSFAKSRSNMKTKVGPLMVNGIKVEEEEKMVEIFKEQYESQFSTPRDVGIIDEQFFDRTIAAHKLDDLEFTQQDIVDAISQMKTHSQGGADTWSALLIKNCKQELKLPLYIIWRKSLDTGEIPDSLKKAIIVPIYKGENRSEAKNYRPVALTSHLIKIFERVIRYKIYTFLETNNKLSTNQHGFREGRSCLSQLLSHQQGLIDALEENNNYDVIYTDFAKAFDKCDHKILAIKLREIGITGKIGRWIHNFLIERKQNIKVNNVLSEESSVKSSVPQGTVLAPLLFLILINDIGECIQHSTIATFADDTKISIAVKDIDDVNNLQEDLNNLFEWAVNNNMEFNPDKFVVIRTGKNDDLKQTEYRTTGVFIIERKDKVKDLGIVRSEQGMFDSHIETSVNKSKRMIGQILRVFKSRDAKIMIPLFKALVLPVIEYCLVLTSPYKQEEIN